jgi:hypothetical protein
MHFMPSGATRFFAPGVHMKIFLDPTTSVPYVEVDVAVVNRELRLLAHQSPGNTNGPWSFTISFDAIADAIPSDASLDLRFLAHLLREARIKE